MNVSSMNFGGSAEITSGASAPMSPTQKMSSLFDAIDPSGSGSITQAQFDQAFGTLNPPPSFQAAGADAIWSKLDPNGTGSVSKQDFVNTMTQLMKQLRGHHHHRHSSAAGASALTQGANLLSTLGQPDSSSSSAGTSVGSLLDLTA